MKAWLDLPHDPDHTVPLIKKFVRERKGTWDKIICLGMGGSALGIVTVQKALFPFDDRLTVIDNLDAVTLQHHLKNLKPQRTLILVISKSGTTLETMTLFSLFRKKYSKKDYQKNFIVITDPKVARPAVRSGANPEGRCGAEDSELEISEGNLSARRAQSPLEKNGTLREIAERDKLPSFPIPPEVGGRFSVLSVVGLLPLALLGGSPEKLLKGAQSADKSLAKILAMKTYELSKQGVNINAMMIYSDHLAHFGLWYQQLLAESIGKSRTVGITPLPLRGASDQHSVLQLLQDGPNDKFIIFLTVKQTKNDIKIPDSKLTVHQMLNIEAKATEQALREDDRSTVSIDIDKISEFSLGMLFMLFEMQIARLGELFHVNAFDQPGVEKSKKIIQKLL